MAIAVLCASAGIVHAAEVDANLPGALRAQYGVLQDRLSRNAFGSPLYLESSETQDGVVGDIYAVVDYPFATVGTVLNKPGNWCDILMLHLNTKYCRASTANEGHVLNVSIGKKMISR